MALLAQNIDSGRQIGEAFVAAGFSPFECHLVAAGERGAQLETVFERLALFWERQLEMRRALMSPLYYPIAVLHLAIIGGSLIELAYSSWPVVVFHLIVRLLGIYALGFILYLVVRLTWSSETGQRFWLSLPLVGRTLSAAHAYRWITALKIEYSAGIPMPNAIADAWRASGYVGNEQLAVEGEQALRDGTQLSALVQRWRCLPRDWIDFIETGEISGALETTFAQLDDEAGRAWTRAEKRLTEWLPKILYFVVLLIAAWQVLSLASKVYIDPMTEVEKAIDQSGQ